MSVVKSIELLVPKEVYLAGSEVAGQLVLTLHSTLVDPLVKVELVGRGYLEWVEEANVEKDYSQRGTCVNKADYVHKSKTFKIERSWLGPGAHIFDFRFILPPRIPSTFTSRVGRISYFLQAICATRELILGKQKKYILVQGTSVFRQDTVFQFPLVVEIRKMLLYNCCFQSAPVTVRLSLEKGIFTPGDEVAFAAEISNETGKSLKKVVFALYSVVLYKAYNLRAERRTLEQREEVARLESPVGSGPSCPVTRVRGALALPPVLPVSSGGRRSDDDIMEVGYELSATAHFPWCLRTVAARIPIVVRSPSATEEEAAAE
nr:arrestin domain-containing protein 5 [Anolis sagrei ordinatus]